MRPVVLSVVAVLVAVAPVAADAAKPPRTASYDVACSFASGQTTVSWSNIKLGHVVLTWYRPTGSDPPFEQVGSSALVQPKRKPSGQVSAPTPEGATHVSAQFSDLSGAPLPDPNRVADCT